jgi:hypothetical protein
MGGSNQMFSKKWRGGVVIPYLADTYESLGFINSAFVTSHKKSEKNQMFVAQLPKNLTSILYILRGCSVLKFGLNIWLVKSCLHAFRQVSKFFEGEKIS